jgi:hypothetical protein
MSKTTAVRSDALVFFGATGDLGPEEDYFPPST